MDKTTKLVLMTIAALGIVYIALNQQHHSGGQLGLLALAALYFVPAIIAERRHIPNANAVTVVNIFLGWTFIGWVVALAMAVSGTGPSAQRRVPDSFGPPASAKSATNATKKCPDCAETVLSDARGVQTLWLPFRPGG
jgi:hypothetical protein